MIIPEANPHRVGACPHCGNYRTDGKPPYLHNPGCPLEHDLQIDRYLDEVRLDDLGGPTLYCTEHDHGIETGTDVPEGDR